MILDLRALTQFELDGAPWTSWDVAAVSLDGVRLSGAHLVDLELGHLYLEVQDGLGLAHIERRAGHIRVDLEARAGCPACGETLRAAVLTGP